MGYSLDLDEYAEERLLGELTHRAKLRDAGKCDYCGRKQGVDPSCKFPDRHAEPEPIELTLTCVHYRDKKMGCMRCTRDGCGPCTMCLNCTEPKKPKLSKKAVKKIKKTVKQVTKKYRK